MIISKAFGITLHTKDPNATFALCPCDALQLAECLV
jgi:hypothetical protein